MALVMVTLSKFQGWKGATFQILQQKYICQHIFHNFDVIYNFNVNQQVFCCVLVFVYFNDSDVSVNITRPYHMIDVNNKNLYKRDIRQSL